MSWDIRDTKPTAPSSGVASPVEPDPASPPMVPTLALLHGLDDWLVEGFTLDHLSAVEQEDAQLAGFVSESQWAARRRLMTRGIVEME